MSPLLVYHLWLSLENHYQYQFYILKLTIHLFSISGFTDQIKCFITIRFQIVEIFRFIIAIDNHLPVTITDRPFIGWIIPNGISIPKINGFSRFNAFAQEQEPAIHHRKYGL